MLPSSFENINFPELNVSAISGSIMILQDGQGMFYEDASASFQCRTFTAEIVAELPRKCPFCGHGLAHRTVIFSSFPS